MAQRALLTTAVAVMLVLIPTGMNVRASQSGSGKIVFVKAAMKNAIGDIYVMNEDGSNTTRLWAGELSSQILHLAVSPDGRKIAFSAGNIYVINADGSGLTQLTSGGEIDEWPAFSPDGGKIAFQCHLGAHDQVCLMNADGSNITRLTDPPSDNLQPAISSDGKKIIFISNRGGKPVTILGQSGLVGPKQIYMMNVDGANVTRLTNSPNGPVLGAFSPDGRKIVFATQNIRLPSSPGALPTISGEVDVMNADGSDGKRLMSRPGFVAGPVFSSDGKKIAFVSAPTEDFQIFVMDADGSNVLQLTNPPGINHSPVFIP